MKKIPVWKNVLLIVALLTTIIIATLAWFYTGPQAHIEDIVVKVGKATYVQVSGDSGSNWSDDLDVEIGINKNFKEISGNGTTFFSPLYDVLKNEEGGFAPRLIGFASVTDQSVYYEQVFEFRADSTESIYLSPESLVAAVDEEGNSFIDAAVRVAFYEISAEGNDVLRYIWAPNSRVEYFANNDSFTREGAVEPYYYIQKTKIPTDTASLNGVGNENVTAIPTGGSAYGYSSTYRFMWSNGEEFPDNAPALVTLNTEGEDGLFYKRLKIKVWLEGHDRECVSRLIADRFTMKLQFNTEIGE